MSTGASRYSNSTFTNCKPAWVPESRICPSMVCDAANAGDNAVSTNEQKQRTEFDLPILEISALRLAGGTPIFCFDENVGAIHMFAVTTTPCLEMTDGNAGRSRWGRAYSLL